MATNAKKTYDNGKIFFKVVSHEKGNLINYKQLKKPTKKHKQNNKKQTKIRQVDK